MRPKPHDLARLLTARQDDLVRYLASRLPIEEDARDLAQEAYLRLLRLDPSNLVRHPEAYLFRIAANLVHEHWLKTKLESTDKQLEPDEVLSPGASPEALAGQRQSLEVLERALQTLPPLQQQVVLLQRRDGLTYTEIAERLGISRDMVKKHLTKGLSGCRRYMRLHKIA